MHDLHLDPLCQQVARDPKTVAAGLVDQRHPPHCPPRGARLGHPPLDGLQQSRHIARLQPPPRPPRHSRNHRPDLPRLAAQFECDNQRAIMIKGGPGVVRIELLWHRIAPVYRSWTTDKISNAAAAHPHSISTWPSTPWVGRNEDVDTRIKSAQDEFQL